MTPRCWYPAGAFYKLAFGRRSGPFARHRYEATGTMRATIADGIRVEKRCVRCGNTIWRRPA